MPAKSRAQLKAMYAAAAGKSNIGIPAKVGKEFVRETPAAKRAALMHHQTAARKGFRRRSKEGYV